MSTTASAARSAGELGLGHAAGHRAVRVDDIHVRAARAQLVREQRLGDLRLREEDARALERLEPAGDLRRREALRDERGLDAVLPESRRRLRADRGRPCPRAGKQVPDGANGIRAREHDPVVVAARDEVGEPALRVELLDSDERHDGGLGTQRLEPRGKPAGVLSRARDDDGAPREGLRHV